VHAFGHNQESFGSLDVDGTIFINACSLNERYVVVNSPIDIEI
jgi:Icc-related predicted phosphoesterase